MECVGRFLTGRPDRTRRAHRTHKKHVETSSPPYMIRNRDPKSDGYISLAHFLLNIYNIYYIALGG